MIIDRLENGKFYPFGWAWEKAFSYLRGLTPDVEEGRYPIRGDEIFALVSGYKTRSPAEGLLEAHRAYVDIQTVLLGRERCAWLPVKGLAPQAPFDSSKDVGFFPCPSSEPSCVELVPGLFAALFPQDAHMPGMTAGEGPEQIKKVVVKIKGDLLIS